jgi:hypothetical protein
VWHYALRLWCHTTPSATCPPSALIGCERCAFVSGRGPLPRSTGERAPLAGIFHPLATLALRLRAGPRCAADSLRSFQLHIWALRYGSFSLRRLQRHTTGSVPSLRSCVFAARSACSGSEVMSRGRVRLLPIAYTPFPAHSPYPLALPEGVPPRRREKACRLALATLFPPALREIGRERCRPHDRAKPKRAPCAPLCYCAGARAARTPLLAAPGRHSAPGVG